MINNLLNRMYWKKSNGRYDTKEIAIDLAVIIGAVVIAVVIMVR